MTDTATVDRSAEANESGYRTFRLGGFTFARDEHFAHIEWPTGRHVMSVEVFLKALMRDVAWNFFYGIVNFDSVIGTMNHYGNVDLFAGRYNDAYRKAELDHQENFPHDEIIATFKAMLDDRRSRLVDAARTVFEDRAHQVHRVDTLAEVAVERHPRDVAERHPRCGAGGGGW